MKLSVREIATRFTVLSPRYYDNVLLIMKNKVGSHNIIDTPKWKGHELPSYISGKNITKYPLETHTSKSGRKNQFYAVSCDSLS